MTRITVTVDGSTYSDDVEPRMLLVHYLREVVGRTGTVVGCDTSNCGACTVHLDGRSVKSCNVLAVQADGREVATIEGLAQNGELHPMQEAFRDCHALQCGYCTPGMIMQSLDVVREHPNPSEDEIREVAEEFGIHALVVEDALSGHQRAKLERYGDVLFMVLRPARYLDDLEEVEFGEVHVLVGPDFVVTIRHAESPDLGRVRRRLEADPALLAHGPEAVGFYTRQKAMTTRWPHQDEHVETSMSFPTNG